MSRFSESSNKGRGKWIVESDHRLISPAVDSYCDSLFNQSKKYFGDIEIDKESL